ncbi:adenosine deaminase [Ponticoccus sp. SC2-23]|uniref:adenosine deaminase n=1 Tax=Alexandriicola marinus TaxID=2081710 RepID=UPI000FD98505|nr:adenosine deaminase [Alexandriicola marinus]MBM1221206.1 adenosine deaminase [Ponticoccus sp. SC6-9]MBM1225776.1 adenosine deaminase [Ponticoccus sp. SC6-15]MBM1227928.1 adenosine deaminase [Ponticoccus sp. SC6-38]MBM1234434.1 adenosine deaminase [Ponticoccus sp. SC6-45]MBM1238430.1 adenosine deaminase [Ponticoccus sp. SC6-49]MBM1243699.1 adenosine deaminase [Ponticoccus sp. SC2-64]MBM1247958.1 adenosine deaminase [Ponticoccus sp. SC6-42]MBM1252830.1 adenosine deaminase [Ponticoccus sp. 
MSYKEYPKVELHLHLEGGAPPAFIRQLAHEKKTDLSRIFREDGSYEYRDFDHFLTVYEAACSVLQTPEDFRRLVLAVMEQSAENGVVYSETFLSPDFCGGGDLSAWREYLHAMQEAADEAERKMGVTLRGIITCIRHFGPEKAKPIALCAAETMGDFITGFGMAGAEMVGRPGDYSYAFDMAREAGLRLTCHAGEWGGPDMVADTLRDLAPERIGHGVNAIHDLALVDRIAEDGIVLEVCPGSNVFLGATGDWPEHPIRMLRERGVKVTVSTDDPPYFGTTMTREFEGLARAFDWTEDDFAELNRTALDAAFCDDATKDKIAKLLEAT